MGLLIQREQRLEALLIQLDSDKTHGSFNRWLRAVACERRRGGGGTWSECAREQARVPVCGGAKKNILVLGFVPVPVVQLVGPPALAAIVVEELAVRV